jgi:hypothetical protein
MHDFYFGYAENIWKQLWKVSAQKTDLFIRNVFFKSACTHQKCRKNGLFSEVNFRHPAVKTIFASFFWEINALSPGYNTFEKMICRC